MATAAGTEKVRRVPGKSGRRLEAADWVEAAMQVLADSGINGVRVESLARDLQVTKGSFYWHFKDRDALLQAVLNSWRRKSTLSVMTRLEGVALSPEDRLKALLAFPFASPRAAFGSDVELAIRLWGRVDRAAREVLAEVDQLRLRYIAGIFAEMGFSASDALARAVLAYGFMRVGATLPEVEGVDCASEAVCAALLAPGQTGR